MMNNTVTVLIPTYRPGNMLRELLRRLKRQSHVPEKVIILNTVDDGGSIFGTYHIQSGENGSPSEDSAGYLDDLAEEFEGSFQDLLIFHVEKSEFGHGKTRDLGFQNTDTDLVLCMTQDALPRDRMLVGNLEKAFRDPLVAAAYGRQLAGKKSGLLEREARAFNYPAKSAVKSKEDLEKLGIKTFFCSDVCAMWRRSAYFEAGGFEQDVIFNEDMILAGKLIEAGYRIAYCADAQVWHSHNYSGMKQLHRNFDLGVSQADHPEIFGRVSSGKEGALFVRTVADDLMRFGKGYLIPQFIWQCGCRLTGYRLGRNYRKLPAGLIRKLTDSPVYWEK